jgi:hypothetical protein
MQVNAERFVSLYDRFLREWIGFFMWMHNLRKLFLDICFSKQHSRCDFDCDLMFVHKHCFDLCWQARWRCILFNSQMGEQTHDSVICAMSRLTCSMYLCMYVRAYVFTYIHIERERARAREPCSIQWNIYVCIHMFMHILYETHSYHYIHIHNMQKYECIVYDLV